MAVPQHYSDSGLITQTWIDISNVEFSFSNWKLRGCGLC